MGYLGILFAIFLMSAYIWKFIIRSPGYLIGNAVVGILFVLPICIVIGAASLDAERHAGRAMVRGDEASSVAVEIPEIRNGKPIRW